jgi:hypothetical protein
MQALRISSTLAATLAVFLFVKSDPRASEHTNPPVQPTNFVSCEKLTTAEERQRCWQANESFDCNLLQNVDENLACVIAALGRSTTSSEGSSGRSTPPGAQPEIPEGGTAHVPPEWRDNLENLLRNNNMLPLPGYQPNEVDG